MPQRFLRPGITTSDRWNAVSWEAQSFYIRILTLVDDFGRYDGRIAILHGQCFALRNDIKPQRTAALRSELVDAGLLDVYSVEGKEYLQVTRWQERARSGASKYPDPQDSAAVRSGPQDSASSLAITSSPLHPRPSPSSIVHGTREDEDRFIEAWNALPYPFPKMRMTDSRRKVWKTRMQDSFWREHWSPALLAMPERPHLRGENEKGWIADVDWFLKPDSVTRISEGKYKNGQKLHIQPRLDGDF